MSTVWPSSGPVPSECLAVGFTKPAPSTQGQYLVPNPTSCRDWGPVQLRAVEASCGLSGTPNSLHAQLPVAPGCVGASGNTWLSGQAVGVAVALIWKTEAQLSP